MNKAAVNTLTDLSLDICLGSMPAVLDTSWLGVYLVLVEQPKDSPK